MPMSVQKSTLTKFSASKPFAERTPVRFKSSILSTPTKNISEITDSPNLKSTAKSNAVEEKEMKRKKQSRIGFSFWRILVGLSVIFAIDSAFSWLVSEFFRPRLSPEIVMTIGEQTWVRDDLNGKFEFLQKHLEGVLNEKISNCSSVDSNWKLNQDGLLKNSHCTLYKSLSEEVSIWGWPLQNSGMLVSSSSCRSLTILSGKVTEWPDGRATFSVREANSSWKLGRLSSSVVQMDPNTWFLEYVQNGNSRLSLTAVEFLISRVVDKLKSAAHLFGIRDFIQQYGCYRGENSSLCPT